MKSAMFVIGLLGPSLTGAVAFAEEAAATEDTTIEAKESTESGEMTGEASVETTAAEAGTAAEAPPPSVSKDTSDDFFMGLSLTETVGYGALTAGGVMALTGIILVATRNDAGSSFDGNSNTVTITKSQSKAPGYSLMTVGLITAGAGAAVLWLLPALDIHLLGSSTVPTLTSDGESYALGLSGTF